VALDPLRPAWRSELAYSLEALAALQKEQGDLAAARAGFLAELAILQKLLAANPNDAELRFGISNVHSWIGDAAEQQGDYPEAMRQYQAQAAQIEQLVRAEPRTARWQFKLADALMFQTDILMATGQFTAASERLKEPRRQIDELVAHDQSNRHWQAVALYSRLQEAMLARQQGDLPAAMRKLDETRPQLEILAAAEPTDRTFVLRLALAWRMEAQLRAAAGRLDAAAAAAKAVELGEKLVREGHALDVDVGECAMASVVSGEIAAHSGDGDAARRHWQHATDLLAPRLTGTRNWRLLDPAARAAAWLGRSTEAHDRIAQLNLLGYVPLDPWPDADRPAVARNPDQ
jgi:tetratricopeptide (TPR) repeat protein